MMENYTKNYENGYLRVYTDYSIQRYSPDKVKVVPKRPLTKKEQKLILELDFPILSRLYARAFANLLSAGETPDDLIQETYFKLPLFFARYDKSFLTPTQRKDFTEVRRAFIGWFNITAKYWRDKTHENIKLYRDTKYGNGKNQKVLLKETFYESLHSVSSDDIQKQRFLDIRRALWVKLPKGPQSLFAKDKARTNLQTVVDMRDEGSTIATIRYQFDQFGWRKDERIKALEMVKKYLHTLWEKTHHFTGQEYANWAGDWLEAIDTDTETAFIKSHNKSQMKKVA